MNVSHIIRQGDTIQRIAQQYGIDDWRLLVEVNNLRYPFVLSEVNLNTLEDFTSDRGTVKILGQTLLIPTTDLARFENNLNKELLEEAAYGLDLDVTSSHRLPSYQSDYKSVYGEMLAEGGDVKVSRGVENLRQSILTRLSTPLGTLELHPWYGSQLTMLIGEKRTDTNIIKMKLEAERTILSDRRVSKVEAIEIKSSNANAVLIDCRILPQNAIQAFRFSEEITSQSVGGVAYA